MFCATVMLWQDFYTLLEIKLIEIVEAEDKRMASRKNLTINLRKKQAYVTASILI